MNSEPTGWAKAPKATTEQWIDAFGQMMRLPFAFLTFGMEMFGQTLHGLQNIASPSVATTARPLQPLAPARAHPESPGQGAARSVDPPKADFSKPIDLDDSKPNPLGAPSSAASNKPKEIVMADTNLNDDMVKLVSYSIVCIARDHERTLVCNECRIFSDNMTDCDFDTWVIAEYVQNYHEDHPDEKHIPCNKKDLRVVFQVLGRWPRQDLRYEEKQLGVLEGIREAIIGGDDDGKPKALAKK